MRTVPSRRRTLESYLLLHCLTPLKALISFRDTEEMNCHFHVKKKINLSTSVPRTQNEQYIFQRTKVEGILI